MSYEKKEWKNGDVITADLLNRMEDGIAEGGQGGGSQLIVENTYDSENDCYTLDKTWQEIFDAHKAGGCLIHKSNNAPLGQSDHYYTVAFFKVNTAILNEAYQVTIVVDEGEYLSLHAASADGYPTTCSVGGDEPVA